MDLSEVSSSIYRHPWELSRSESILKELQKLNVSGNVLDIGCGDGYFDRLMIKKNKSLNVYGVDIYLEETVDEGNYKTFKSLKDLPDIEFDYIIMMDVLEHIKNDKRYLEHIKSRLKDDGKIIITVPAYMKLYSLHDKELRHYRRYDFSRLSKLLKGCDLKIEKWSYFYFSLILARLMTMNKSMNIGTWDKSEKNIVTWGTKLILNIDYSILSLLSRFGIHIPGLSLFCIASKS